jgi:hypothetical protein
VKVNAPQMSAKNQEVKRLPTRPFLRNVRSWRTRGRLRVWFHRKRSPLASGDGNVRHLVKCRTSLPVQWLQHFTRPVQSFARARFRPKGFGDCSRSNLAMGYCKSVQTRPLSLPGSRLALFLFRQILPQYFHLRSELIDDLLQILDRGQLFLDSRRQLGGDPIRRNADRLVGVFEGKFNDRSAPALTQ